MSEIPKPVLKRAAQALNQSMAGDPRGWEHMQGEAAAVLEAVGYAEMVGALKAIDRALSVGWGDPNDPLTVARLGQEATGPWLVVRSALNKACPAKEE